MNAIPYSEITKGTGIHTNTISSAANENRITKGPKDGTVMPDYRLLAWLEAQMRRRNAGINVALVHGIVERLRPIALGVNGDSSAAGLTREDVLEMIEKIEHRVEDSVRLELVDATYAAIADTAVPPHLATELKGRILERLFSRRRRTRISVSTANLTLRTTDVEAAGDGGDTRKDGQRTPPGPPDLPASAYRTSQVG